MNFKLINTVPKREDDGKRNYAKEISEWGGDYANFEYELFSYYRTNEGILQFVVAEEELTAYGVSQVIAFVYLSVQINPNTDKLRCQITRIDANPHCRQLDTRKRVIEAIMANKDNILGDETPEEFAFIVGKEDKILSEILNDMDFKMTDYRDVFYAEKYLQKQVERGEN